ncbi:carboxylesterase family protein [Parvularcula oceani]|uniref:carboxylesterase family protein n=1 Tax=Parvularcula oceani TaxID=1247963 RepID=UPI0004E122A3|nr:carboxylesterase family protein [Parvularcula oceani]
MVFQPRRGAPVYVYQLTWETPVNGGALCTPHTLDIPFMFDNVDKSRVLVGPGEEPGRLADMMSDAWLSFAKPGEPKSELMPEWKAYSPRNRWVMQIDLEPEMVKDPERAAREVLSAGD